MLAVQTVSHPPHRLSVQLGSKGTAENQGLTEIKASHLHGTLLTHRATRVIAEGKQVGQLQLALGTSMLAVPNTFSPFTDLNTTPRRTCFTSLPRDEAEDSQAVIPHTPPASHGS